MKLWFKQQDYYKKNGKEAKFDEIEDFYVNIYEEEVESTNNQLFFNKKNKGNFMMKEQTTRVLGFWCFNASLAMKGIQEL